jgi:hypothetical protein
MLEGKLPAEFAEKWKWRPGQPVEEIHPDEPLRLLALEFEETDGGAGSARPGPMAHTWGN